VLLVGATVCLAATSLEIAVKATFLYKFAPFVQWPAGAFDSPSASINICVVGQDPFGATLDQAIYGQRIAGRPIALYRLAAPGARCHIAFIGGSEQFVAQTLDALRGSPVLTVTDAGAPTARGIINFAIVGRHVRFDIDEEAAARNGLTISSKLLSLARSVRPRT
jgi:hypothetical protein